MEIGIPIIAQPNLTCVISTLYSFPPFLDAHLKFGQSVFAQCAFQINMFMTKNIAKGSQLHQANAYGPSANHESLKTSLN